MAPITPIGPSGSCRQSPEPNLCTEEGYIHVPTETHWSAEKQATYKKITQLDPPKEKRSLWDFSWFPKNIGSSFPLFGCAPLPEIGDPADKDGDGFAAKEYGGPDCDDDDKNIHPGAEEICNGKDDNCDGNTDEGIAEQHSYTGPGDAEGVGICQVKIQQCQNGIFVTTQEEVFPQNEICDNVDNDCDGDTDEGCWLQVSAGEDHTCGVRTNKTIECWGNKGWGKSTPPSGTFTQVSAGGGHSCGIRMDKSVECWGYITAVENTPQSGTFLQVSAAGSSFSCGLKTDRSIACWGYDYEGETRPPLGAFTQISTGGIHACGVKVDGSVACWGNNDNQRVIPPSGTFKQVSAGGDNSCGLKTDNSVVCWGRNDAGQSSPPPGVLFTQISTGSQHTCGVKTDKSVVCWGEVGQSRPPSDAFTQVDAGTYYTCGVRTDKSVVCWGNNTDGRATPPP